MPLRSLALFTLLLSFQPPIFAANSGEACLKKVFGEYCLGGSMQQLLRKRPHGMRSQQNSERSAVVYPEGRERTYVMAYKGSIYKILHTYDPANRVKLKELRERLEAKYGA